MPPAVGLPRDPRAKDNLQSNKQPSTHRTTQDRNTKLSPTAIDAGNEELMEEWEVLKDPRSDKGWINVTSAPWTTDEFKGTTHLVNNGNSTDSSKHSHKQDLTQWVFVKGENLDGRPRQKVRSHMPAGQEGLKAELDVADCRK